MGREMWRAVRLENEESVAYLNRLLAQGWYLIELGIEGLPYLSFTVPMKPLSPEYDMEDFIVPRTPSIQIIVLSRGSRKRLQLAVVQKRDRSGAFERDASGVDARLWRATAAIQLEDAGVVTIYQRRDAD